MNSKDGQGGPPTNVLVFTDLSSLGLGVQTPRPSDCVHHATSTLLKKMDFPENVAAESRSPHNFMDYAKAVVDTIFLGLLVQIAGVPTTFLLLELEFDAAALLVDHFFYWTDPESDDEELFNCCFVFRDAYITVKKEKSGDFVVTYHNFDISERFGDPRNGGFPTKKFEFNYVDQKYLMPLLPFCPPMILKDASDESYNFAQLDVLMDPRKNFLFFVFRSLSFNNEDRDFEMKAIEFSFPILSSGQSITSPIDFRDENDIYIASFTIKIGDEVYNVCFRFGTFESYSIDHSNGYYTLSAINHWTNCTTIFCGDKDAEELMEQRMSRRGILSIEIPGFVAPETDDDCALVNALTPLPEGLQAFLRSITWRNPKA